MNEPAAFTFDDHNRKGTVVVRRGPYGLDLQVTDGKTNWLFSVDLFYLAPSGVGESAKGCVQIVAYHPQDHDGDPLHHVRVWPDGKTEVLTA